MNREQSVQTGVTRRDVIIGAGAGALALGLGLKAARADDDKPGPSKPYNVLFILTDQERHFRPEELPSGYTLPGRERLAKEGVTFANHQVGSMVCSPSRSVIYTGQHMPNTGVFDNLGFPWQGSLSQDTTTIGDRMRSLGYHSAYLGKWHLSTELEDVETGEVPNADLEALNMHMNGYGFSDYVGVGDIIGTTLGGYKTDEFTTSTAVRWLRANAHALNTNGKPWYLAVNLVNPHDVMYIDTDKPGESVQMTPKPLMKINRAPPHELYQQRWGMPLPDTRNEAWDASGRPKAHHDYQVAMDQLVGHFPNEDRRWRVLLDYYLSCVKDNDSHIEHLLKEIDCLGLDDNTIVVMTSDHGELGGAHGMHGKGACAFREQNHVPLVVRHPDSKIPRGTVCNAVTSHADLTPTLLSMAHPKGAKRLAGLPGKDFSTLLTSPANAKFDAMRDGALYCFNMWLMLDGGFMKRIADFIRENGPDGVKAFVKKEGLKPDLDNKRGGIRSVFDGRYRFSRYFPNTKHNLPKTLEELFSINDVECFDLQSDPNESRNLACDRKANGDLLLAMNSKLTALIGDEIGEDTGQMFSKTRDWAITRFNA